MARRTGLRLVTLSPHYRRAWMRMANEWHRSGKDRYDKMLTTANVSFNSLCREFRNQEKGRKLQKGYVPCTWFWMKAGDRIVGRISVRHTAIRGRPWTGFIGYDVAPSARGKGYATEALRLVLPYAKKIGFRSIDITCTKNNRASAKVIKRNGGVLIKHQYVPQEKETFSFFTIKL